MLRQVRGSTPRPVGRRVHAPRAPEDTEDGGGRSDGRSTEILDAVGSGQPLLQRSRHAGAGPAAEVHVLAGVIRWVVVVVLAAAGVPGAELGPLRIGVLPSHDAGTRCWNTMLCSQVSSCSR